MAVDLDLLERISGVFIDAWVVVDGERRVLAFNPHYRALFPRAQARKLKGSMCCQFLRLGVCEGQTCLARRCIEDGSPARYDEISAVLEGDPQPKRVIASAVPLSDEGGEAALILLRDVSDQADVQRKYKGMLERETHEKELLREEITRKTKELMDANIELNRIQRELMRFKKGLFGNL